MCRGVDWQEAESLQEVAADVDVLYQTRIQKERFQDRPEDYEKARGKYIINADIMKILPKSSVVMHPLPRVDEVNPHAPRKSYLPAMGIAMQHRQHDMQLRSYVGFPSKQASFTKGLSCHILSSSHSLSASSFVCSANSLQFKSMSCSRWLWP